MAAPQDVLPVYLAPVGPPVTPQALQQEFERLQSVLKTYQAALLQLMGSQ